MEYARWDTEGLLIGAEFVADTQFFTSPEELVDDFVTESNPLERSTHSSRAMWPETELDGVKFDIDSPSFKGEIRPSFVKIRIDDIRAKEEVFQRVRGWFENTELDFPEQAEFDVESMWCVMEDDSLGLTIDGTKCTEGSLMGCKYTDDDQQGEYMTMNGFLSVMFGTPNPDSGKRVPQETAFDYLESLLEDNRVLVAPMEEIKSEVEDDR